MILQYTLKATKKKEVGNEDGKKIMIFRITQYELNFLFKNILQNVDKYIYDFHLLCLKLV